MSRQSYSTREPWRIIVVGGSRNWTDEDMMINKLNELYSTFGKDMIIMSGEQRGADLMCKDLCKKAGIPYAGVPAWWEALGDSAGPKRNRWILRFRPEEVHLFITRVGKYVASYTPGSGDMKQAAENLGIATFIYRPETEELWQRRTESARQRAERASKRR